MTATVPAPPAPAPAVECAGVCGQPARPGDAYCGPWCRNRDNNHDTDDDPEGEG